MEVREGLYIKEFYTKLLSLTLNEIIPQAVKLYKSNIYKNVESATRHYMQHEKTR